ncbi:MAG: ATP-binding cassette domain-containing protein [Pseudomonadota bacterium]
MPLPDAELICRNIWKLFGPRGAEQLGKHGGHLTDAELVASALVPAVRGVDLAIGRGEIFVIMGLSGSGKSTLLRCLSRLIEPDAGEILFQGTDLRKATDARMIQLRRHAMGMVFQHFALLPHLTVLQNVAFPLQVQGQGRGLREETARRMVALVGLSGREAAFPRELSGGQQQRVGIARSLAADPALWFLDEPFSALDPLIRREMQDEFLRLQASLHKTILFVTHDFDEAIRLADRIAIMKDGAVVQVGTPEDIVLHPASDYVRAFTAAVPRARVVRVGSVMVGATGDAPAQTIAARATVADAAPLFVQGAGVVAVTAPDGQTLGHLHRQTVIDLMLAG